MKKLFCLILFTNFLFANKFYYEYDKKVELKASESDNNSNGINEYVTNDGKIVRFANEIIVQCKENAYCKDDFEDLNLTNIEQIDSRFFLIKLDNFQDIFEYCEKLYHKKDIDSALPNFITQRGKR